MLEYKNSREQADNEKSIIQGLDNELNTLRNTIYYANVYFENKEDSEDPYNTDDQYKGSYRKEHEHRVHLFENAKDKLKSAGIDTSTLNIEELQAKYNNLLAEKTALNNSCLASEKAVKDLKDMGESLNKFLNEQEYTHAPLVRKSNDLSL